MTQSPVAVLTLVKTMLVWPRFTDLMLLQYSRGAEVTTVNSENKTTIRWIYISNYNRSFPKNNSNVLEFKFQCFGMTTNELHCFGVMLASCNSNVLDVAPRNCPKVRGGL